MHQTDRLAHGIDNENGAAVSDINSETNARLIRDQAVTIVETIIPGRRLIDHADPRAMHLLSGNERRAAEPVFSPNFTMNAIQARQRFHFVVRHLQAGNTQSEAVNDIGPRLQRRKMLSRELTLVHLPELVLLVLVAWTGCRLPAGLCSGGPGF